VSNATETPLEADRLIIHVQVAYRAWRNVQHDLPVTGEPGRDLHAGIIDVDQQVRRAIIVHDPLVERSD
jgi:hypothetical protein